jgi:hypothetical protein
MDTFSHIKTVIGIILSLSIALLLQGTVKMIQHPGRTKPYWVHLLWALYIFLMLIHFWWWEYKLKEISEWIFPEYFFIIVYIMIYYALCALLFPSDINDYEGSYEKYFYSRKNWFFIVLAICFVLDFIDTSIKGRQYLSTFHYEYYVRTITHIVLCLLAIKTKNRKFHAVLPILFILYEISFILRLYLTA